MDIQEMKKVNELSRELQKHGIVKNSQEGAEMATSFVNPEKVQRSDISERYEVMMDRMNRKFSSELDTLKDQMSIFKQELTQVKEKMGAPISAHMSSSAQLSQTDRPPQIYSSLPIEKPAIKISPEDAKEQHRAPELRHEVQAQIKTEAKQDHPRTGGCNPEDVAIDKIFYFGKK